jgi:hypothetical protein
MVKAKDTLLVWSSYVKTGLVPVPPDVNIFQTVVMETVPEDFKAIAQSVLQLVQQR